MHNNHSIHSNLLENPRLEDMCCSLAATAKHPKGIVKEAKEVLNIAREFNEKVCRYQDLELDATKQENPDYLPWEIVQQANRWGFYSMFIPKIFGGQGYNLSCMGLFLEELASVCLGIANITGVHYLGISCLTASWNLRMIDRISRDVVNGEKKDQPCLVSLAITEPEAGTDSQNIELMDVGKLGCLAQRVNSGYLLNGSKIFISMGHISTWHIVNAYTDLNKPSENMVVFAVKTGTEGFSLGKKEDKMGQLGCPASELIFKDCLVPEANVCIESTHSPKYPRGKKGTNEQILSYVWGSSRMGVASFGAGAARGAYQEAVRFARNRELNGELLINQQWCQSRLAEMYKNVTLSRTLYLEATYANAMYGLWKILNLKPLYYLLKVTPLGLLDWIAPAISKRNIFTALIRKFTFNGQTDAEMERVDGMASLAKIAATDAGIENCKMATEIMGQTGLRQDKRVEKIFRDAKLLQIYEGTNQVNRVNVFKRFIKRHDANAEVFRTQSA